MTNDSNLKSGSTGFTRRFTLLAGVGLAAAGTFQRVARNTAMAQDASSFYPPVKPGIEPRGARVQPYPAACVQSGVVPTFDASGNFLPDALNKNVEDMCGLIRRGADEHGARLMSFPEFGLQIPSAPITAAQWWPGTLRANGPEIERIGKAAQDANAYVAFNPIEGIDRFPGRYFLAGMIVGPSGDVILNYRKLTGLTSKTRPGDILSAWLDHFGEDSLFPVADTPVGRLACVVAGDELSGNSARHGLEGRGSDSEPHGLRHLSRRPPLRFAREHHHDAPGARLRERGVCAFVRSRPGGH